MRIVLTKLTDRSHRFEVVRDDGSREEAELETRSLLLHDLVHYAVEAEARLERAFFGCLAAGTPLAELQQRPYPAEGTELALAETLVGPLQTLFNGGATRAGYLEHGRAKYPDLVDDAFVDAVLERLRRLVGEWRATPFGRTLELAWPPSRTAS